MIYHNFISANEQQIELKRVMSQELFIAGLVTGNSPLPLVTTTVLYSIKQKNVDSPGGIC